MVNIDCLNNISFIKGETVNLFIKCNDYSFDKGDKLKLRLKKDNQITYEKEFDLVDNGIIFINLSSEETNELPTGEFTYSLFAYYGVDQVSCIIENNLFTVKEG